MKICTCVARGAWRLKINNRIITSEIRCLLEAEGPMEGVGSRILQTYISRHDLRKTWRNLRDSFGSIDVQYGKCDSRYFTSAAIFCRDKCRSNEDRRGRLFERQIDGQCQ